MHAFIPIVALLGLAVAQSDSSSSTTAASSTNSAADATSSIASCIAACEVGDVNCQAVCVNVPAPNESQILATNECSRNECTQGDSGPEDTKKYGECLASCASQYYYVSGGTPTGVITAQSSATGASTPVNGNAGTTTVSGSMVSSSGSASQTGSSDNSESSASSTASNAAESGASSTSGGAAESTGAAASLSLSNEMLTLSGGFIGLVAAALAL